MSGNEKESSTGKVKFFLSLISFGLIGHRLRKYRTEDAVDQPLKEMVNLFSIQLCISYNYNLMFLVVYFKKNDETLKGNCHRYCIISFTDYI